MAPVDFDDNDLNSTVEEVGISPTPTPSTVQASKPFTVVKTKDPEPEEYMSEVEARLEMAQYYRLVLNEPIFEDRPNPEVADIIEGEIREFIKSRMQALIGLGDSDTQQKVFSDAEVLALRTIAQPEVAEALKALAAKVMKKPAILDAKPLTPEISIKLKKNSLKLPTLKKIKKTIVEPINEPVVMQPSLQPPPVQPKKGKKTKMQEKQIRTIVTEDGKEVKQNLTPQARPVGAIQPFPTPKSPQEIEAMSAQHAAFQSNVALSAFENALKKGNS